MTYEVVFSFTDSQTGIAYQPGDIFKCDERRAKQFPLGYLIEKKSESPEKEIHSDSKKKTE